MKTIKRINRLTIKRPTGSYYLVYAPSGRILEEFAQLQAAEEWCYKTLDFIRRKPA